MYIFKRFAALFMAGILILSPAARETALAESTEENVRNNTIEYNYGCIEPDWVGEPIPIDDNLMIEDIDSMIEGEEMDLSGNSDDISSQSAMKLAPQRASRRLVAKRQ